MNDLAKRPGSGLAALGGAVEGLEEARPEHVQIPRLVLKQGTSKDVPDDVKLGEWWMRTIGRNYGPRVLFLPIAMFNSRTYFLEGQPKPECSSLDGVRPVLREGEAAAFGPPGPDGSRSPDCERCHFAQWQENTKPGMQGKRWQPCAAQISFLGFALPHDAQDASDYVLCTVTLRRRGWKAGQQIITTAKTCNARTLSDFLHVLWSTSEQGPMSKYAVAQTSRVPGRAADKFPALYAAAAELRAGWAAMRAKLVTVEVDSSAQDDEEAAAPAPTSVPPGKHPQSTGEDDLPF